MITVPRQMDLSARLADEAPDVRRAITLLAEILSGSTGGPRTASGFLQLCLGQTHTSLVTERVGLTWTRAVSVGAVLADLVAAHGALLGPVDDDEPPSWSRVDLGEGKHLSVPTDVAASFPAGTLASADVVVQLRQDTYGPDAASLRVLVRPADQGVARAVANEVMRTARRDKAFHRGLVLRAAVDDDDELSLQPVNLAPGSRGDLVLAPDVWDEVDANVAACTTRAPLLRRLGLGTSRGILLAGPPGVGKSALSRAVARELAGDFTVIIVDAAAARAALTEVYRETEDLSPALVILEDIDLYVGHRRDGAGGVLAQLLAVLDGAESHPDVLTIASTNDPAALDPAATRSSRFDSVIRLAAPDRAARARILAGYLGPLATGVDTAAVAAALPPQVSGADVREVVRRAVLSHGEDVTTQRLLDVVRDGRWKPAPLVGSYL